MWICTVPRREHTSKVLRYSTRSQGISQFYLLLTCSMSYTIVISELGLVRDGVLAFTDCVFYR